MAAQQNGASVVDEHDNIEVLEEKAQRAKREATAKRKQIPPFVQKLNSFLEDGKNTDLIRWSDKGDSFIVLDEDEFAKTLIPELFKHNNYASFVRQLNMYGFHKKVGLSDNSMKASERKNKSPSEYYNPYFKRGHPNLLWLINKPKSGTAKKKTKRLDDVEVESDDDGIGEDGVGQGLNSASAGNRALPAPESGPLPKRELSVVHSQIHMLQEQQRSIAEAIKQLRQNHAQLSQQAIAFQEMHNRHEHSINAILSFLANVFRKSLEEQGGAQNVNDIIASIIPNLQMTQQGQGSIVDLGDYVQQQAATPDSVTPTPKRAHRLLPPIPQSDNATATAAAPASVSPGPSSFGGRQSQQPQMGSVTELFDTPPDSDPTPAYLKQELESNEGMMRIIQDANTNAGTINTPIDLSNMTMAANASANLTNDQRNRMLNIMSGNNTNVPSHNVTSPHVTSRMSPAPPSAPATPMAAGTVPTSLSPILGSAVPPLNMHQMSQTQEDIEALQKLQEEQGKKLEDLSALLGPYSPSGKIPGVDSSNGYFDDPIDFGQYLDNSAFAGDGTGVDFDFNTSLGDSHFDAFNPESLGVDVGMSSAMSRIVETATPSQKSPSLSSTEEISREGFEDSPGRTAKRQRMG